jgi:hypothetical protein
MTGRRNYLPHLPGSGRYRHLRASLSTQAVEMHITP